MPWAIRGRLTAWYSLLVVVVLVAGAAAVVVVEDRLALERLCEEHKPHRPCHLSEIGAKTLLVGGRYQRHDDCSLAVTRGGAVAATSVEFCASPLMRFVRQSRRTETEKAPGSSFT